jgi:hypothetical protein
MKPMWLIKYRWPITGQQYGFSFDPDWDRTRWDRIAQHMWYSASLRFGNGELEIWYKFGDPEQTHHPDSFERLATIANTEKNIIAALEPLRTWMEKT